MKISGIAAFVAVAGLAAAANAQVTYSWSVVSGSTTLNPGESVTVALSATHAGQFYAGGKFNVRIDGLTDGTAGASEAAGDTDVVYSGRRHNGAFGGFRNFPSVITYTLVGNVLQGSAVGGSIDHAVIVPLLGGNPDTAATVEFFRMTYTAGSTVGLRTIVSQFTNSQVGMPPVGIPAAQSFTDGSIDINVVPAPASLALLGLGGLVAGRRRR